MKLLPRVSDLCRPKNKSDLTRFDWDSFLARLPAVSDQQICIVDEGAWLQGTLLAKSVRIRGYFSGFVMGKEVVIDQAGRIDGTIFCRTLFVAGGAAGTIFCTRAVVTPDGTLNTKLSYQNLEVATGGKVSGDFERL